MTQQYLAGELSLLLAELPAVATTQAQLDATVHLRHVAETVPVRACEEITRAIGWVRIGYGSGGGPVTV